ncbi:hypothetical protein F0L74_11715 [Chitinophaga agrisoli]|uniref:Uncharacterized protein n=1 Tax=Chitinophaga agrisoli TaxID=2607653 RepID=A0A5B2VVS0_9BACT|nr:hypothetical protein [Chitinophaga agrisoli]KAA2243175.1 hypothetical protein F0L74_11715 [Chitinophaga agrisoli]
MKYILTILAPVICLLASCAPQHKDNRAMADSLRLPSAASGDVTTVTPVAQEKKQRPKADVATIDTALFFTYLYKTYKYDSTVERRVRMTTSFNEDTISQTVRRTTTFRNKDADVTYTFNGVGIRENEFEGFDSSFVSITVNGKLITLYNDETGKVINSKDDIDFDNEPLVFVIGGKQWLLLQGSSRLAEGHFRQIMHTVLINMSSQQPRGYLLYSFGELAGNLYPKLSARGDSIQLLLTSPTADEDGSYETMIDVETVTLPLE